jgi:hypothetical protein
MPAGITATITTPALNPMRTAPRGFLYNFYFMSGRMLLQVFAVVGDLRQIIGLNVAQDVGQCHIPEAVMVAIGLTVSGDMDKLGKRTCLGKGTDEPLGELFPIS